MATTLKYGSSGGEVEKLQEYLNATGRYKLDIDGQFGQQTQAAVMDYQKVNNLAVDGIVGNKTWGALTSKNTNANVTNNAKQNTGFTYDKFTYDDYAESDTVKQARASLQTQLASKPGQYQPTWQGQINSIIDNILNREDFSYDVNSDALYQQYKDQYTTLGKLASQDVMGQAAAMTGGYGSSYASTAGNQAYQAYLSQLNEVVPELYGMALDRYNQEGEELYNNYALLADQENQAYNRYQDGYNQWLTELQLGYDRYDTERNFDYSKYATERDYAYGVYSDDKSYAYNEYRNAIADAQWQKEFDEGVRQFNANHRLAKKQYEATKASGGSSGGSGGSGSGGSSNDAALEHVASMSSAELVETMQAYNYDGDNTGLAAFLDDCVASGRLTEEQADNYYSKYRTDDDEVVDTTVTDYVGSTPGTGGGFFRGGSYNTIQ